MKGILSIDDIAIVSHGLFKNYRYALGNYFNEQFKNVNNVTDLDGIDTLFIVDEHFTLHVAVWKTPEFINALNQKKIKTVVFNFEKIFDSAFPWNINHQKLVESINGVIQFVSDVNDAKILGKTTINKQLLSRDTFLIKTSDIIKKDEIAFIGQLSPHCYYRRQRLISDLIQKGVNINVINTDRKMTYNEYLHTLASYKYILNPLGTGDFINIRYYEAIDLGCIPLQQFTDEMVPYYNEFHEACSYNFRDASTFGDFRNKEYYTLDYYLENYFEDINLKHLIS